MSRLTLRLPETLHRQLESLARNEAVSLNQYIVFALTRQATLAYTVRSIPEEEVRQQQAAFTALLQNLGQATHSEIKQVLDGRRRVKPKQGLSPEIIKALKNRIVRQRPAA